MNTLQELKQEAQNLGITFSPNSGAKSLQSKIDDYKASLVEKAVVVEEPIVEQVVKSTVVPIESTADSELEGPVLAMKLAKEEVVKKRTIQQRAKDAEKKARATRVIEIIDNDSRVNGHTSTCSATCGNVYFDLGTIILPLNTPVEVMQGHIDSMKEVTFPHHQINQKTGLNSVNMRKRFTISYVQ